MTISRNWQKFKEYRRRRQLRSANSDPRNNTNFQLGEDDEPAGNDVPDGQLCVVCLMRRRTTAFTPCGHLVCCNRCAVSVEREVSPKCPICRMPIRTSMRIFLS